MRAAHRPVPEGERQPVLGLDHMAGAVEPKRFGMPRKIGDGHEQVERLGCWQQSPLCFRFCHCVERVEQHAGKNGPAKGRREPAGTDEARKLAAHFLTPLCLDRPLDRAAAPPEGKPGNRCRPEFGEGRNRPRIWIEQPVHIGIVEPHVGQRIERLAAGDRLRQENAVDPARAGARNNVCQDAKLQVPGLLDELEKLDIDRLDLGAGGEPTVIGAAGADKVPDLLGDAVHVDGKADPAITDKGEPEFLLPHAPQSGTGVCECRVGQGPCIARALRTSLQAEPVCTASGASNPRR